MRHTLRCLLNRPGVRMDRPDPDGLEGGDGGFRAISKGTLFGTEFSNDLFV